MRPRHRVVLVAALAAMVVSTASARTEKFPAATYTATMAEAEWTLQFGEGGEFTVKRNGEMTTQGTCKVAGEQLEFIDREGPLACLTKQPGTYTWKLEDKTLTLTKVKDDCKGRSLALTRMPWARK